MQKLTYFKILFFTLILFSKISNCQINNYSQYYFNELMLNPSLTGLMESKWRVKHFRKYLNNDDLQFYNNTYFADLKFIFSKQVGEYGLNIKEFSGWMMGLGIIDNRIEYNISDSKFRSNYLSLAFHKKNKKDAYFSFSIQPGYLRYEDNRFFDFNTGVMFSKKHIVCWQEDQFFRSQLGFSAYNVLSDFKQNDSIYSPGRKVQAHYGYLINEPKHFNIFSNALLSYDSEVNFSIGANVLFFPIVHYRYFDRGRLGLHYRSSNHLVFSAGCRLYGRGQKTLTLDMNISYDFGMKFLDLEPSYKNGIEFGVVLTPFVKCWSLSKC